MAHSAFLQRYIGDREFYKRVVSVALPIMIQNIITNFVNLLDNIMVGQVGTEPMSGVAIVNQLLFVFNLCIFGGLAGAGIFTAQFFGKKDMEGVRHTFHLKLMIGAGAAAVFAVIFLLGGDKLISLYLHEGQDALDLGATLEYGRGYMHVMLLQLLPFALIQTYAGTLRETGETMLPMKAGIIAVFVNLVFNYILIFGRLGAPALGVVGAAIATVLSRFVELGIVVVWSHTHLSRCPFLSGGRFTLRVPLALVKQIAILGAPLLLNEVLWSSGMATLNQCYSVRGLEVVSAVNISSTVSNLFMCAFFALGNTVAILVGQFLGAGELERAEDEDRKLIVFSVAVSFVIGALMAVFSPLFPQLYNTTETARGIARNLLYVTAAWLPLMAYCNCAYFTLRSGGKTVITFLFDCGFIWCLQVPLAMALSRLTAMPILGMFICVQATELVKCVVGFFLLKKRTWIVNLVK